MCINLDVDLHFCLYDTRQLITYPINIVLIAISDQYDTIFNHYYDTPTSWGHTMKTELHTNLNCDWESGTKNILHICHSGKPHRDSP